MKEIWNILLYIIAGIVLVWVGAVLLLPVGLPFLLGLGLERISRPLQPKQRRSKLANVAAVLLVFAGLCTLLFFLGRVLLSEAEELAKALPAVLESLSEPLQRLYDSLQRLAGRLPDSFAPAAVQWVEKLFAGSSVVVSSLSEWVLSWAARLLGAVPKLLLFVLTTLLSACFFAVDRESIMGLIRKKLPEHWLSKGQLLLRRLKTALGGYCKAQIYLSGVTLLLCALGLFLLKQKNVLLLAFLIALVDALPVFGAGTVLIPWGGICFLRGDSFLGIGLLLLYAAAAIVRTVLEPRFLGKQIGLHPLLTLLALYAGFRLFGIGGMLLLPIATMMLKQLYDLSGDF